MIPALDDDAALLAHVTERVHIALALQKAGVPKEKLSTVLDAAAEVFTVGGSGALVARPGRFSVRVPGEPLGLEEWLDSILA